MDRSVLVGSRRTTLLVGALVGLVLPLAAVPPAGAEPGCVSEVAPEPTLTNPLPSSCDDSTPPDTSVTAMGPVPNASGWLRSSSVTVSFAASASDGDVGPWSFECRLTGPSQGHGWRACTSPVSYSGLADAAPGSYVFEVRAVDAGDVGLVPLSLGFPKADTPDLDDSPARTSWGIDTVVPREYLTVDAYDELTPERPVLRGREVAVRFSTSEPGAVVECTDDGQPFPCAPGRHRLEGLASGDHGLSLRAVDPAGNASGWSEPVAFTVPTDLERRRGWRSRRSAGHLDGDVLVSKRRRARLVVPARVVRELRLYADSAPRAGAIRVRVGRGAWRRVRLRGEREAAREFVVLGPWDGVRRGKVRIETVGRRPVRLDAIVIR